MDESCQKTWQLALGDEAGEVGSPEAPVSAMKRTGEDSQRGKKAATFLTQSADVFLLFIAPYLSVFSTFYL